MPVCTWVCALSFGRCRMSKFFLLVYFGFFGSLRPSLIFIRAEKRQQKAAVFITWKSPCFSCLLPACLALLRICVGLTPPKDWFSDQTIHLWFLFVVKK